MGKVALAGKGNGAGNRQLAALVGGDDLFVAERGGLLVRRGRTGGEDCFCGHVVAS